MRIARIEALILRAGPDGAGPDPTPRTTAAPPPRRALDHGYDIDRSRAAYPGCVQTLLVRVTADDGLVGYGEAHAPLAPEVPQAIIRELLAPILVGQDPLAVEVLWESMYSSMRIRGHRTGFMMEAISGVDIALWDLLGKAAGLPVYRLLGGGFRDRVNAYASGVRGATPDEAAADARRWLDQGFTALKLGIGGRGLEAGLGSMMAATLLVISILFGAPESAIIMAAMLGAMLAFLKFNWFPARIFPGDSLTLMVGASIATTVISPLRAFREAKTSTVSLGMRVTVESQGE